MNIRFMMSKKKKIKKKRNFIFYIQKYFVEEEYIRNDNSINFNRVISDYEIKINKILYFFNYIACVSKIDEKQI